MVIDEIVVNVPNLLRIVSFGILMTRGYKKKKFYTLHEISSLSTSP